MNRLYIYPTSRAIRSVSRHYREQEGFLPTLMRMDEFENRALLLPDNAVMVDPLQRVLLLREALSAEIADTLKLQRELIRFFGRSDAIFKFYEELSAEGVLFETLRQADAYAEFDDHLDILERLFERYRLLLRERGLTDKALIPLEYSINKGFVQNFTRIEIFLEGYLSRFELTLLQKVSALTPVTIHYQTSPFNQKMQERFAETGCPLPQNASVSFDLGSKTVLQSEHLKEKIHAKVIKAKERIEQVALAFEAIEEMTRRGIAPERIALVLPDEGFKQHFMLFDRLNNLNFAMGYDYSEGYHYKSLEALYRYWQQRDTEAASLLQHYRLTEEQIAHLKPGREIDVRSFFEVIAGVGLFTLEKESREYHSDVEERYRYFMRLFKAEKLSLKEWLFLWLKSLSSVTLDDVRGGKVTVLGVLETRGVAFEGVVIVDFNEGIVPAASAKDQFLNSRVRSFASLPTRSDREGLQKQYYKRLLEGAQEAVILYSAADEQLPSKFIYELGLGSVVESEADLSLLYPDETLLPPKRDPTVETFQAEKIAWSPSRLKTFLDCKRKYYYRYIEQLQPKAEDTLNEGAFLHKVLEYLFREQDHYLSTEEMRKAIDRFFENLLPYEDAKSTYQKFLWREKLKGFIEKQVAHFEAGWRVVEREMEVQGTIGGLKFKGRIDRIDQNETHTLVLDYKSGSTKEAQKSKNIESLNDLQMSIYSRLLEPKYQNLSLAFVKLFEEGEMEEIKALEAKNERLSEVIVELKQTKSFAAERCEDLQQCKWCEFALMCERGEYL